MRERQQMASRPFASVDVALEVGAEQTDFLRGPLEVGTVVLTRDCCDLHIYIASLTCICFWNQAASDYPELTSPSYMCFVISKAQIFNLMTQAVPKATGESISLGSGWQLAHLAVLLWWMWAEGMQDSGIKEAANVMLSPSSTQCHLVNISLN